MITLASVTVENRRLHSETPQLVLWRCFTNHQTKPSLFGLSKHGADTGQVVDLVVVTAQAVVRMAAKARSDAVFGMCICLDTSPFEHILIPLSRTAPTFPFAVVWLNPAPQLPVRTWRRQP